MTSGSFRVLILRLPVSGGRGRGSTGSWLTAPEGFAHSLEPSAPFVESSDYVIASLPIGTLSTDVAVSHSPESDEFTAGLAKFRVRVGEMQELGVNAVHLASGSLSDVGQSDVKALLDALDEQNLKRFGAGRSLSEALEPLRVEIPRTAGGGQLNFYGFHMRPRSSSSNSALIAREDHVGLAPLSTVEVPRPRLETTRMDAFHVAMPSWRTQSAWRSRLQYSLVHQMLNKDFDLVLGTGTERMQEVHRKRGRWVVYGLGDSPVASHDQPRSSSNTVEALPFTLWAMLEVHDSEDSRRVSLKLYPVRSGAGGLNDVAVGPVSGEDFETVVNALSERPVRPWRFDNPAMTTGADELGHHLKLDLGAWSSGLRPSRLEALTTMGDPNEWPLQSPGTTLEDAAIRFNKPSGAMTLPLGAQAAGAEVWWLADSTSVIDAGDRRFLTNGPTAHESDVGSRIVGDKALTAELLQAHGVSTPRTEVVRSAEDAIGAARAMTGPVVIKPKGGNQSRGVATDLISDEDVRNGFEYACQYSDEIIVQEHIEVDQEMRVMASPDEVVAVNVRVFPHVMGDGSSTVQELIRDKNLQRARNTIFRRGAIPIDGVTLRFLERQGITLEDVPAMGEIVTVRNVGGNSMGADIKQDLENTSHDVKDTARQAIAAIPGLVWGGVDLITDLTTGKAFVIEINTNAGFLSAAFPTYGQSRDVTKDIYRLRYADTAPVPASDSPIQLPDASTQPVTLWTTHCIGAQESSTIGGPMHDSWLRQGLSVERITDEVSIIVSHSGVRTWVTAEGRTSADRYVLRKVMRHHYMMIQLLEEDSVPVVRSQAITSTKGLVRFVKGRTTQVVLMSTKSAWNQDGVQTLTEQEALDLSALPFQPTWVQARPSGRHLRVLATPDKAWVITEEAPRRTLSATEVEEASRVAVRAVRAVPELRWVAVDLILRRRRLLDGRPDPVLVEGMSLTPRYSQDDHVMAGDFDEFCRHIIQ